MGDIRGRFTQGNVNSEVRILAPRGYYLTCEDFFVGGYPGTFAFAT